MAYVEGSWSVTLFPSITRVPGLDVGPDAELVARLEKLEVKVADLRKSCGSMRKGGNRRWPPRRGPLARATHG